MAIFYLDFTSYPSPHLLLIITSFKHTHINPHIAYYTQSHFALLCLNLPDYLPLILVFKPYSVFIVSCCTCLHLHQNRTIVIQDKLFAILKNPLLTCCNRLFTVLPTNKQVFWKFVSKFCPHSLSRHSHS